MHGKRKAVPPLDTSVKRSNSIVQNGINKVKNYLKTVSLGEYLDSRPPSQVVSFDVKTTFPDALLKSTQSNLRLEKLSLDSINATFSQRLYSTTRVLRITVSSTVGTSCVKYEIVVFAYSIWPIFEVLKSIDLPSLQAEELPYQLRKLGEGLSTETLSVLTELEDGELVYKANKGHSLYEVNRYGFARTHGKGRKSVCHRLAVFDFLASAKQCLENDNSVTSQEEEQEPLPLTEASESCSELNVKVTDPLTVEAVISQSDLLRFIYQKRHLFQELLSVSIADLKISEKPVVCVPGDMSAVHTFASMFAWNVKSAGIVDNHNGGVLVANLSASDLRGIQTSDFALLALPVLSFLQKRTHLGKRSSVDSSPLLQDYGLDGDDEGTFPKADAIHPQASLEEAIEHLVSKGHHRVYVTNQEKRVQGIITITDILRLFL